MPSLSTHSRLDVPALGCTRTDFTRPATLTRWRADGCDGSVGTGPLGQGVVGHGHRVGLALAFPAGRRPVAPVAPASTGAGLGRRPCPDRRRRSCSAAGPLDRLPVVAHPLAEAAGRLYGMMVALTWGTCESTAAILSAVRSCRNRCHTRA